MATEPKKFKDNPKFTEKERLIILLKCLNQAIEYKNNGLKLPGPPINVYSSAARYGTGLMATKITKEDFEEIKNYTIEELIAKTT